MTNVDNEPLACHVTDLADVGHPLQGKLCQLAYQLILRHGFPSGPLSEDPSQWIARLKEPRHDLCFHFFVAHSPKYVDPIEADDLYGVALVEYFTRSRIALLTYIHTRPVHMRRGIARRLLKTVDDRLRRYKDDVLLLAEVDNATQPLALQALGFERLPFPYAQPPLLGHHEWVTNLGLWLKQTSQVIIIPRLIEFQEDYARSLGVDIPPAHDFHQYYPT